MNLDQMDVLPKGICLHNGTNFSDTINLSAKVMNSTFTEIAASGDNVYSIWTAGPSFRPVDLFYSKSSDAGRSFGPLLKVNRENGTDIQARVAAFGNNVYIAWTPDSRFWHGTISDLLLTRNPRSFNNFCLESNLVS